MDRLTPEQRSWIMSRIRGTDTKPEVLVRSMLHRAGYRFRKNVRTLPGKPDIVLPKYKTIIFVHGCFWHRHKGCKGATTPKSNKAFWKKNSRATSLMTENIQISCGCKVGMSGQYGNANSRNQKRYCPA
jgi:DNA mismatch endonuclease (patch repair protein)